MPTVHIPSLLRDVTAGRRELEVDGTSVREILDNLERSYPGLKARILEGDHLRPNISVAVDGEISALGLSERVESHSEIHFVAAIRGGNLGVCSLPL
jgi:molybdopterin synthase sulfur carrier subunit